VGGPRRSHQTSGGRSSFTSSASKSATRIRIKSLNEALYHGGFHRLKVNIKWIEAESLEEPNGDSLLDDANGILVPGASAIAARAE
jgi:CTP synthase (UTP-ammonia lyase)